MKKSKLRQAVIAALLALLPAAASAQTDGREGGVEIIHECDTTWHFGYYGISLYSRLMHRIDIAYPTVDANGNGVRLSGSIVIPGNVYDGSSPVDGVVLYNRYTQMQPECCPTQGFAEGEFVFMCNPLNPNWILVESDFYGFGVTADHVADQYYVFGDANGHASIDCLLAARQVLDERGLSQGKYLFNVGVSSGGYDCLAAQRVRDMHYKDKVNIDKTLAAAAPFDVERAFSEFIDKKDSTDQEFVLALIVFNSFNRHEKLGFTPQQWLKEPLASKFDGWFNSARYNTLQLRDSVKSIGVTTLAEAMQPQLLDRSSDEFKRLIHAIEARNLQNGWTPDASQSYYYLHYAHDKTVPTASGRALLSFLTSEGGYKKSIVPELTNLTTCMYVMSDKHTLSAIHALLRVAATLTAHPVLYYDGELNTHYYDLVKVGTPMGIIQLLEEKGIDVAKVFSQLTGSDASGGSMDFFSLMATLAKYDEALKEMGTSMEELIRIADDSGLSIADIIQIITYLNSKKDEQEQTDAATSRAMRQEASVQLVGDFFYNKLLDWLNDNGVELDKLQIGL